MTVGLEKILYQKYNTDFPNTIEGRIFSAINVIPEKIDILSKSILDAENNVNRLHSRYMAKIKSAKRIIQDSIVRASKESAISRLYIQELVSDKLLVKDGSVYGILVGNSNYSTPIYPNKIEANYVYKNGEVTNGEVFTSAVSTKITPTRPILDTSTLVIDITLKSKELISSILIKTKSIYSQSIYYYSYNDEDFIETGNTISSIITLTKDLYTDKIRIVIRLQNGNSEVEFEELKLIRMAGSQELDFDITQNMTESGTTVEVVRCDSENKNIEYLVSTNNRVFKNATDCPVSVLGIEDGDIIGAHIISRYRANNEDIGVFSSPFSYQQINSNYWNIFTGLSDYKISNDGGLPTYEAIAIYKDIFTIRVSNSDVVYIDDKRIYGEVVIYPGVKRIKIIGQTRPYDLKFYKGISYDGSIIKLTKINGTVETIGSQNNIFAQIDSTAAYIFSSIGTPVFNSDNNIEYNTEDNYIYIGYSPIKTSIENIKIRVLFKNSDKVSRIDHLAIKIH